MKKKYVAIITGIMIIGIFYWYTDKYEQTQKYNEMIEYPVIEAQDLDSYDAEDGEYAVITDIHITGDTVTDPKGLLEGNYIYIDGDVSTYYRDSDNEDNWAYDDELSYNIYSDNLSIECFPDETFDPEIIHVYNFIDTEFTDDGNTMIEYNVIAPDDTLTALAQYNDGTWERLTLYSNTDKGYIFGTVDDYYQYLEDFMIGDSILFYVLAIIVAAIVAFIGWIDIQKTKLKEENEEESTETANSDN